MLLQAYGGVEIEGCLPMSEWRPEAVGRHIDFQRTLDAELLDSGEHPSRSNWPVVVHS